MEEGGVKHQGLPGHSPCPVQPARSTGVHSPTNGSRKSVFYRPAAVATSRSHSKSTTASKFTHHVLLEYRTGIQHGEGF